VRIALALAIVLGTAANASAQSLTLHVDSRDLYAGMPFVLSVEAKGFDEKPEPKLSAFTIPGARVTYLGASPNVSTMMQIMNGVTSQSRDVTFVYRFRVDVRSAGTFNIPPLTAEQGARRAESHAASFQTRDIERTNDMRVKLILPNRPLWAGETFEVSLDWYLRRDVANRTFVVPLFDAPGVSVEPAPQKGQRTLAFSAGAREIALPYERGDATLDGTSYARFRFGARVTVENPATLDLPPTRVIASLEVGQARDFFGFATAQQRLFKAEDTPQKLEVRPLPLAGRPASFRNAVGSAFAIDVQANRTVVSVGEPIELKIAVHGKGRLDGLLLPPLDAEGGLQSKLFSWPDESPAGETIDDGKGKLFRVIARLKSTEAREVPPLSLSYFDPETGQYRTARSQPIALSVRGASVVAGKDVVRSRETAPVADGSPTVAPISLTGVDLSLSAEDRTLRRGLSMSRARPLLAALYAFPIFLLAGSVWRRRTRASRDLGNQSRAVVRALAQVIAEARTSPAKDSAARVARALTEVARQLEVPAADYRPLVERLETESYDPRAANQPIAAARLDELLATAHKWEKRSTPRASAARAAVWLAVGISLAGALGAAAEARNDLAAAREVYRAALKAKDRDRRTHAFAGAEASFRELARAYPDRPELLADWGNAALGAEDLGPALLAYRRALRLEPGLERARSNLAWVRRQIPAWVPHPRAGGAAESLFFWHQFLSRPERQVAAGAFFALALVLFAVGAAERKWLRLLRRAAAVPLVAWAVLVVSLWVEHDSTADAVLTADAVTLRSADSIGAPAVYDKQLPAGTECTILEKRDSWLRIQLADGGTIGWVAAGGVEPITPDERPSS
jgi:hypothetical protein